MPWLLAWVVPGLILAFGALTSFGPPGLPWANAAGWLLVVLLVVVSATDLSSRRIPNWATYTAILWGLLAQVALAFRGEIEDGTRWGFPRPMDACVGFLLGAFALGLLYAFFGGGAGDVKLAAAMGLFLGPAALAEVLFATCLVAGLASCLVVTKRVLLSPPGDTLPWRDRLAEGMRGKIPMAPFFLVGLLLHWTPPLASLMGRLRS